MVQSLDDFRQLAAAHTLIPITREVFSDLETPVTAFWKLKEGRWSFLLESVEGGEKWARYTFMGTRPRAIYRATRDTLTISRPGRPDEIVPADNPLLVLSRRYDAERVWVDPSLPRFFGGLVGTIDYDAVRWFERIPDRHAPPEGAGPPPTEMTFVETSLVLVWDNLKHRAQLVYLARTAPGAPAEDIDAAWAEAQSALDHTEARLMGPLPPLPVSPDPAPRSPVPTIDDDSFDALVDEARGYIAAGDCIQIVLARRFDQPRDGLHPFLIYRTLRGLNPSPYMFYLEQEGTTVVGASPEVLVRQTAGLVEVRPIAGTRRRGVDEAEDQALARELAADPKEVAEHVMLVDLGRNDVGRVCQIGSVEVAEKMVIERYSHVMHLVSHVTGQLADGHGGADVIAATFPAGTLTGAPKIRAMELIDQMESSRRGLYGGAVGVIGAAGDLDLCIAIRTVVATEDQLCTQAGAGIVWDSVPASETDESERKASAVHRAIDDARRVFYERSV